MNYNIPSTTKPTYGLYGDPINNPANKNPDGTTKKYRKSDSPWASLSLYKGTSTNNNQKGGKKNSLENRTKEQLVETAKKRGIKGTSKMSKNEIISQLRK